MEMEDDTEVDLFPSEPDDPDNAEIIVVNVNPDDFIFSDDSNDSCTEETTTDRSNGDSDGDEGTSSVYLPSLRRRNMVREWFQDIPTGRMTFLDPRNYRVLCNTREAEGDSDSDSEAEESVPAHRWFTKIVCGEGQRQVMAEVTGPNKGYLFQGDYPLPCSTDEDTGEGGSSPMVSVSASPNGPSNRSREESPNDTPMRKNKFGKNTVPKSSKKVNGNDSHVGEQTPDTVDVNESVNGAPVDGAEGESNQDPISMRLRAAYSPQSIRVRDMPLPDISFTDSTELSLLMCFKEDIGIMERSPSVYRRTPNLSSRMRAILLDWLMEVCDVYKLRRVTYYLAVDFIDRYLSRISEIPKNHLQLLGITCLFIAAKVEEIYPPKLVELAYVTDGACTDVDMLDKELDILTQLRWDIAPLTVTGWLCLYLQLACTKSNEIRGLLRRMKERDNDVVYPQFSPHMFMTGSMLIDICSLDDGMLQFKYSVVAASAIYYLQNREKALFVSGYTWDVLQHCVEWMLPFAMVVNRTLVIKPIVCPREYNRKGSALRVSNPSIVLDEGHTLQNHLVNLKILEEVYNEVKTMRQNYNSGQTLLPTGWTISNEGYDASLLRPERPRRTSMYKQSSSRNDYRLHYTSNEECERERERVTLLPYCDDSEDEETPLPAVTGITPLNNSSEGSESASENMEDNLKREAKAQYEKYFKTGLGWEKDFDKWWRSLFVGIKSLNNSTSNDGNASSSSSSNSQDEDNNNKKNDEKSNKDNDAGKKRPREDDSCEIAAEKPRKKSCCQKNKSCKQMLASPQCSGLYLKPGEKVSHRVIHIPPVNPVLPPQPAEPVKPEDIEIKSEADLHAWWRAKLLQRRKDDDNDDEEKQ